MYEYSLCMKHNHTADEHEQMYEYSLCLKHNHTANEYEQMYEYSLCLKQHRQITLSHTKQHMTVSLLYTTKQQQILSFHFIGIFHVNLGSPVPECLHSGFYWSQG